MVEPEDVPEQARKPALERIEVGERVVADAEQDVHGHVGPRQNVLERTRERASVAAVVEDVLLHLVEDHVELGAGGDRTFRERIGERDVGGRAAAAATARSGSSRQLSTITTSAPLASPPTAGTRVRSRAGHACAQERALADATRPVEHRQPGRHQVRRDELRLALAAEEEERIVLGVAEVGEPLERRRRQVHAAPSSERRVSRASSPAYAVERDVVHLGAALPPELGGDVLDGRLHRPGAVGEPVASPDPAEEDPKAPVVHRVAEEEEVTSAQASGELDRHRSGGVAAGQVVDVIVLADGEALPLARAAPVDVAVDLEQDASLVEREAGVRVRLVDHAWRRRRARRAGTCRGRGRPRRRRRRRAPRRRSRTRARRRSRSRSRRSAAAAARGARRSGGSAASHACSGDGSTSWSSARCSSSWSGPIPFRAATACETYASPRPSVSSNRSARARASSCPPMPPAAGPAPGRAGRPRTRAAPRRSGPRAPAGATRTSERSWRRIDPYSAWSSGPGSMPELVDERPAGVVVGGERLGLPTRAIEGEHQLRPQPLAQRMPRGRATRARRPARSRCSSFQLGSDPLLEHAEAQILEPADLVLRERLAAPCRPAARRARARAPPAAAARARGRLERARLADEPLEAAEVELVAVELEHVPGRPRVQEPRPEQLAKLRDRVLERGRRGPGRMLAPELVDEPLRRDGLVRVQEQDRRAARAGSGRRAARVSPRRGPRGGRGSGTPALLLVVTGFTGV